MCDPENCNHPDIIREDWYKVCTECGLMFEPPFFDRPEVVVRQGRTRLNTSKYSRVSNFELHLKQLQGEMKIPDDVYDSLLDIKKSFQNQVVSYKTVKAYLKKEKKNKLYPFIPTLMKKFWGISTLEIDEDQKEELVMKFIRFERGFQMAEKGERKNSVSYDFLIRTFLEEEGNPSYVNIPTLTDRKKLQEAKELYSQITESMH